MKRGTFSIGATLLLAAFISTEHRHVLAAEDRVFAEVEPGLAPQLPQERGTLRSRPVRIDFALLASQAISRSRRGVTSLTLDLFDGESVVAELDRIERGSGGAFSWVGHVRGTKDPVLLAVRNGVLAGDIHLDGQLYQVRYAGPDLHVMREMDPDDVDPEMDPFPVDISGSDLDLEPVPMTDDGTFIDIMVVYTEAARTAAGGTTPMQALVDLAITETNDSYVNSGVTQRLNLVHTAEVTYAETGSIDVDLYALTGTTDGEMDSVHTLRDIYAADEVILIVDNGGGYCGIAWLMSTVSSSFESSAFGVVARTCATGYYSFGHELGHNMGARHDRYVDDNDGPFTYNHGYLSVAGRWRTVMAYNSECSASGVSCTRIPYWSNPDVTYSDGRAMGIPEGAPDAADNRKTLNNTAFTVANFRESTSSEPSMTEPTPGGTLVGPIQGFNWTSNGVPVTDWWLMAGSSQGDNGYYDSGSLGSATSDTATGLPTDGSTVHVRLWYEEGGTWYFKDYQYLSDDIQVILDPIADPIVVGGSVSLTGSGFTAGSVIQFFVATSSGAKTYGPYAPSSWSSGSLTWQVDPSIPLGNGFGTVLVINTDQGYVTSNAESQLLHGDAGDNIPTILSINGVALSAVNPSVPVANVETVVSQGVEVTLTGTGFSNPLVNLFTADGNLGPITPTQVNPKRLTIVIPAGAPTGPASFQVVNDPYTGNVQSNAVSAVLGSLVSITSVSQVNTTVTVDGTGFSTLSVINFFNDQPGGAVNLGGLDGSGNPNIPLTFVNETRFTFTVPAGAQSGASYVQVLNPPFIPYSSSGNDPDGAFTLTVP